MRNQFLKDYLFEQALEEDSLAQLFNEKSPEQYDEKLKLLNLPKPPNRPLVGRLRPDAKSNYQTIQNNPQYGITGLMAMNTWKPNKGPNVQVGDIFLFPGTHDPKAPAYKGKIMLDGKSIPPLYSPVGGATLHSEMCNALGRSTKDFVGFAIVAYPWYDYSVDNMRYKSCTCNKYWFGQCFISTTENGAWPWGYLVWNTLKAYL